MVRTLYRLHIEERDGIGETAEIYLSDAEADAMRYVSELLSALTIEQVR